ncbi:MAG: hypothetical protein ACP5KB_03365, partial [Thermoprotei archaeon]
MNEEKAPSEEPYLLLEVLELNNTDSLLQVIEKHRDVSGVYLGKPVEEISEKFVNFISRLSKLRTQ